jgi:hypothetical protein
MDSRIRSINCQDLKVGDILVADLPGGQMRWYHEIWSLTDKSVCILDIGLPIRLYNHGTNAVMNKSRRLRYTEYIKAEDWTAPY